MPVQVHLAEIGLVHIKPDGTAYSRSRKDVSIKDALNFSTEHRILLDSTNANTANHPTLKSYLQLEAGDGFEPVTVTQSFVITKQVT